MKLIDNKQYGYVTLESMSLSITIREIDGKWMLVKNGRTSRDIDTRVKEQVSAAGLSNPQVVHRCSVEDNTDVELDNKIRNYLHTKFSTTAMDWKEYDRPVGKDNKKGGGKEWSWVYVEDILNKIGTSLSDPLILENEEFLTLISERIHKSKQEALKNILGDDNVVIPITLRPWQQLVFDEMLGANKKYNLLSLAPRFGKTLLILEHAKYLANIHSGLYLCPLSKDLSSNNSFVKDYDDFGYNNSKYKFNMLRDISLYLEDDKLIDNMESVVPVGSKIYIVTDEADLKSNTKESRKRLDLIKSKYDVVTQVSMSGTNIGRASKIFIDVPDSEIFYKKLTYTEMYAMGGEVVKRNFVNVQYDLESYGLPVLKIREAFAQPKHYNRIGEYLIDWFDNTDYDVQFDLQDTNVVMAFIECERKADLDAFVKGFETTYKDRVECVILTGDYTTNGKAENATNKKIKEMKQNGTWGKKKLVTFSIGMGSRSYSISENYRTLVMKDGPVTYADIQKYHRSYTWEKGKKIADTIRIGFTPVDLVSEVFMLENETIGYDKQPQVRRFLKYNNFTDVTISQHEDIVHRYQSDVDKDVLDVIDRTLKFTDKSSYLVSRTYGYGIKVDVDGKTNRVISKKNKTTKTNSKQTTKKKTKQPKEDEKALKAYWNHIRCIPSIMKLNNIDSIDKLLNWSDWKSWIKISKSTFSWNYYNKEVFKEQVDALVRNKKDETEDFHRDRIDEYALYV